MSVVRLLGGAAIAVGLASSPAYAQGVVYFPSQTGSSTQLFEDLWPNEGDYDFNDLVLRTHVERAEDAGGNTTRIDYTFNVYALGARQCAAFALRLPGILPSQIEVARAEGTANALDGGPWTLGAITPVPDGAGGSVIDLSSDVRSDLCGNAQGFLNTVPGAATVACAPLGVRITFDTPEPTPPDVPGDLFYYRCGDAGLQVHRSIYGAIPGGAFATDTSLFGTGADDSGGGRFWVDDRGVPWALSYADEIYTIPAENERIDAVLPGILAFAAETGGANFWHDPEPGAFAFTGSPPPLPIAAFEFTVTEEDLCNVDPYGIWIGTPGVCDCHLGGPSWAWNGTACFDDEAGLCADWGGTWASGDCTCPNALTWSGTSCYDATDEQAMACVLGSTSPNNSTFVGGGTWTGTTCDCSAVGVGFTWNGFGCTAPSGLLDQELYPGLTIEGACWAAGGTWDPARSYEPVWQGQPGGASNGYPISPCDCSAFGPGFQFTNVECADFSTPEGSAALCEDTGGYWAWWGGYCDCEVAGFGRVFDSGLGCVTGYTESPGPDQVCVQAGGTWTGTTCDCTAVDPGTVWSGGACVDQGEVNCLTYWSAGAGWNDTLNRCDCSPWDQVWDTTLFQCVDPVQMEIHCEQTSPSGNWIQAAGVGTCDCSANGDGHYWNGGGCVWDAMVTACNQQGGTYRPATASNIEMHSSGHHCDCPAGEYWDNATYECVPYDEFECEVRGNGQWDYNGVPGACACGYGYIWPYAWAGVNYAVFDGNACVKSQERQACEADSGWWDPAANACTCNNGGTWDPERWICDTGTGERECQRAGGTWWWPDSEGTCNCGGYYEAWDPAQQACLYSPEYHACAETQRPWYYGGDPDRPTEHGCVCEAYPGTTTGPEDWDWSATRLECVDISSGEVSCERDHYGQWDEMAQYCNCQSSPVSWSRWNDLLEECVYAPEVEACASGSGGDWSSSWNYLDDACTCYGPDNWADWSWDGTTGACVGPEKSECEDSGIGWWNPYNRTCDCGTYAGSYGMGWSYDDLTEMGSCSNPEYDDCIADPDGEWINDTTTPYCQCAQGALGWSWQWDGVDGFGQCTDQGTYEWQCLSTSPAGTWHADVGMSGGGWCDCDVSTSRRWVFAWATCYSDPQVALCDGDPHGVWDYTTDQCDCSADGAGAWFDSTECTTTAESTCEDSFSSTWSETTDTCSCPAGWTWNPTTETCDNLEALACEADPIGTWHPGNQCLCGTYGTWTWDNVGYTGGSCSNPEYDDCLADVDCLWEVVPGNTPYPYCEPTSGFGWYWSGDQNDGFGKCLDGNTWEWSCLTSAGTWHPDVGYVGGGWCDCDVQTGRRWSLSSGYCTSGDGYVAVCEADPDGDWDYSADWCDCTADGTDAVFTGSECATPPEQSCEAQSGTWNEGVEDCTCPLDFTWDPMDSACESDYADEQAACEAVPGGTWMGTTCSCPGSGFTWNPTTWTCDNPDQPTCEIDPIGYWMGDQCNCGAYGTFTTGVGCANWEYDACIADANASWNQSIVQCECITPDRSWVYSPAEGVGACAESGNWPEPYCLVDPDGVWNAEFDFCTCAGPLQQWDGDSCVDVIEQDACNADGFGFWDTNLNTCDCSAYTDGMGAAWDTTLARCVPIACTSVGGVWDGATCHCPAGVSVWNGFWCN